MARWRPSYFQATDIAVRRLISAHPEDYNRLLEEAKHELPQGPCESCAYFGAATLELADLLGHDKQGHQVFRALWSSQIHSMEELLRAVDGDLGLHYLHARAGHGRAGAHP